VLSNRGHLVDFISNPCKLRYPINETHASCMFTKKKVLARTLFSEPVDLTIDNPEYHSAPYQKACCKAWKETEYFS
jgi:hypothetical protein